MATKEPQPEIPENVLDVLKTAGIGYLSVTSGKGDLYSYPVAFYFSGLKVYFMTPISAAKLKFIRGNPNVSFLVDNHLLTKGACGVMIQGKAKVFSIAKTVVSIMSVGPKMASFAKKYPGMFTFYASGKDLPDERKLYRYRLDSGGALENHVLGWLQVREVFPQGCRRRPALQILGRNQDGDFCGTHEDR